MNQVGREAHRALVNLLEDAERNAPGAEPRAVVIVLIDGKGKIHGCAGFDRSDRGLEDHLRVALHTYADDIGSGETMVVEDAS